MPPKKKGPKTLPALSKKEEAKITADFDDFDQNQHLKKEYFKSLGEAKLQSAHDFFNKLKQDRLRDNASAAASAVPTSTVAAEPSTSTNAHAGDVALDRSHHASEGQDGRGEVRDDSVRPSRELQDSLTTSLSENLRPMALAPSSSAPPPAMGGPTVSAPVNVPRVEVIDRTPTLTMLEPGRFHGNRASDTHYKEFQRDDHLITRLKGVDTQLTTFPVRQNLRDPSGQVLTNYFEINIAPGTELYEYQIVGIPDRITKRDRKPIIKTIFESVPALRDNQASFATDYNEKIIAWKNIHKDFPVNHVGAGAPATQVGQQWRILDVEYGYEILEIELQYKRNVDYQSLQRYVCSEPNLVVWDSSTVVEALNIMVSKCFDGEVIKIGANKFFVERAQQHFGTGVAMCTLRGYHYSIRPNMGKILLNISTATSVFYKPIYVSEYLEDTTFSANDKLRFLKGVRVYIDYERGNRDKKSRLSGCNRPQVRIKPIFEVGDLTVRQQRFVETTSTRPVTVESYLRSSKSHFQSQIALTYMYRVSNHRAKTKSKGDQSRERIRQVMVCS